MLTGLSSMRLAHQKLCLDTKSNYIVNASKALKTAIEIAEKYHSLQWSIIWIESKTAKKRSLKAELNILAYNCYSYFSDACNLINQQATNESMHSVPPLWWNEMVIELTLVDSSFQREHSHEIYKKQLALF
jgi:hypothetical protein